MSDFLRMAHRCLVAALFLLGVTTSATAAPKETYTIAVVPIAPPVTLHTQWMPFVDYLVRETGLNFRLKLYEKTAEFERDIWDGGPDFIFASPIQTVVAHQTNGYQPLVRGSRTISIGLFVRNDSSFRTIDDLTGKSIAFVGNKNLCSVFILHLLADQKHQLTFDREFAGSTKNVVMNVILGKTDAGAIYVPELELLPEETREQLRPLVMTSEIAPHPLSVHPRIPPAVREAVLQATLALAVTRDGEELLRTLHLRDPIVADYDRDYRSLEAIDIKGLTKWGQ